MPSTQFTAADIPDLSGRVIIVTGGNSGLGYETVLQFAKHNPGRIYLTARSQAKGDDAIKQIRAADPAATAPISVLPLDLASFASVKAAAAQFMQHETRLDILLNNAGIMQVPPGVTTDGYEVQFGTNVMGHALLTQLLLPTLQQTARAFNSPRRKPRVVNVSSATQGLAPADLYPFAELRTPMTGRHTVTRYAISKIGNIHHAVAAAARYPDIDFVAVHPGAARTNLGNNIDGLGLKVLSLILFPFVASSAPKGALSQIWAAVSTEARSQEHYGPIGKVEKGSKKTKDKELADKLWEWIQGEIKGYL